MRISPEAAYDRICEGINAFTSKIEAARQHFDWQYFFDHDDFREIDPDRVRFNPKSKPTPYSKRIIWGSVSLSVVIFGIASAINASHSVAVAAKGRAAGAQPALIRQTVEPHDWTPPASDLPLAPVSPPESYPFPTSRPQSASAEQPLPQQGGLEFSALLVTNIGIKAPLKVTTSSDGHVVMKVEDWDTGEFIASYFINRNDTLSVELPLGIYKLKFASGARWYGEQQLFGPKTQYSYIAKKMVFDLSGDYARGHQIELIRQVGGNLNTTPMTAAGW